MKPKSNYMLNVRPVFPLRRLTDNSLNEENVISCLFCFINEIQAALYTYIR